MQDALIGYLEDVPFATELAVWAGIETCSYDPEGLARFAAVLTDRFNHIAFTS